MKDVKKEVLKKTNKQTTFYASIFVLVAMILIVVLSMQQLDNEALAQVKSGKVELHCAINSDWEKSLILSDKVIDYNAELRYWTFTNGGASNCEIRYKK